MGKWKTFHWYEMTQPAIFSVKLPHGDRVLFLSGWVLGLGGEI